MKIHEYQAKEILRQSGVSVPNGHLVTTPDDITKACQIITGSPWVVKAQIHAGGRGKGGGVKVAHYPYEVVTAAESLLGKILVTPQAAPEGVKVHQVLIEEGVDIDREFYLGMVIDRARARATMIFSPSGGVSIEEVASQSPELIWRESIDPTVGWMPHQARNLVYKLDPLPSPAAIRELMTAMANIRKVFSTLDCSLVEINPLVITTAGKVLALDAKISIDDNAMFRQKDLLRLDDSTERDPLELMAEKYNLNYIRLDGNIGVMVNGAGLAMATMDLIKTAGAEPANFLDVGGGATEDMITKGFEIILKDRRVEAILVNIFGGILRCDVLARGVVSAAEQSRVRVPLIVRLEGTNVKEGRKILEDSGLKFLVAKDLAEASRLVAGQVSGEREL